MCETVCAHTSSPTHTHLIAFANNEKGRPRTIFFTFTGKRLSDEACLANATESSQNCNIVTNADLAFLMESESFVATSVFYSLSLTDHQCVTKARLQFKHAALSSKLLTVL